MTIGLAAAQQAPAAQSGSSAPQTKAKPAQRGKASVARQLHELFKQDWEFRLREYPTLASQLGDKRYNDRWPDMSLAAMARYHQHNQEMLRQLKAIPRQQLSPEDRLNYDLFQDEMETGIGEFRHKTYLVPVNQMGGVQDMDELGDYIQFTTAKDYEDWIARINKLPTYLEQITSLMREGMRERMVAPKVILQRVPSQLEKQIVADPEQSPFYRVFKRPFPRTVPEAEQQRLRAAARQAIERAVPAYRQFKQFFESEYLPAGYDQVGIWQAPNGADIYAFQTRKYTTTDMTPEQIHQLGLSEVKRIRGEMEKVKQQAKFTGTLTEFFRFLRTDPQFYYTDPKELLEGYRAISKRIDPELVKVFKTLPRMPYGVEPIPDTLAPDTTTAYYRQPAGDGSRAGTYFVNLYKPESRPKWEMMALSIHEAVPGHHLQIALSQELGEIPEFRRFGSYTAFTEGWGLYSESLGDELGLYDTPYTKMGQLAYEMWRAVRLVVDTGMHQKKWTRQQAIDFFMENAPKAELDIVNEIDRYIAWPGQALAYKIGELKIKELRARAAKQLGPKFNLGEFHDVVLLQGSLPLNRLEQRVDQWLAGQSAKAAGGSARKPQ